MSKKINNQDLSSISGGVEGANYEYSFDLVLDGVKKGHYSQSGFSDGVSASLAKSKRKEELMLEYINYVVTFTNEKVRNLNANESGRCGKI